MFLVLRAEDEVMVDDLASLTALTDSEPKCRSIIKRNSSATFLRGIFRANAALVTLQKRDKVYRVFQVYSTRTLIGRINSKVVHCGATLLQ